MNVCVSEFQTEPIGAYPRVGRHGNDPWVYRIKYPHSRLADYTNTPIHQYIEYTEYVKYNTCFGRIFCHSSELLIRVWNPRNLSFGRDSYDDNKAVLNAITILI